MFGFDPKSFTDQELLDRLSEYQRKLNFARQFSADAGMIEQLQSVLDQCAMEMWERRDVLHMETLLKARPDTIDYSADRKSSVKIDKTKTNTARRDGPLRSMRSSKPVKE